MVKFQNGGITKVKRAEDNTFKCQCGKAFKLANSLCRHAKGCSGELTEREDDDKRGAESVDGNESDASEHMDVDNRVIDRIPNDCFGTLIPHEKR